MTIFVCRYNVDDPAVVDCHHRCRSDSVVEGDIAEGLGHGSPLPSGIHGQSPGRGLGERNPSEAEASLSALKRNMRFGEIKRQELNSQYQSKNTSYLNHKGRMVKGDRYSHFT